jgi:4'-phosphopantetheinyl transferase
MEPQMRDTPWRKAPAIIDPPTCEIHIWRAFLDTDVSVVQRLEQLLTQDEQARASRFRFDRDRRRFVVGRGLLRAILAHYLRVDPRELLFAYGTHGKPYLESPFTDAQQFCFNMSHSQSFGLYAFAVGAEIGIDVERVTPLADMATIADHFFSAQEKRALHEVPEHEATERFYEIWTKKEAYIKAIGKGLSHRLDQFTVTLGLYRENAITEVAGDPDAPNRWWLQRIEPASGYLGAFCIAGRNRRIYWFETSSFMEIL